MEPTDADEIARALPEEGAALFLIDAATGAILDVNLAAARVCQAPRDALLGARLWDRLQPPAPGPGPDRPHRLRAEGQPEGIPVRVTASRLRADGRAVTLIAARPEADTPPAAATEGSHAALVRDTRLAALGKIAGSVAHDLRNPLGAIRNACFFLRRKVPPDLPKWDEYLGMIEREVAVCVRVINNLMELVQPRPLARETVDLSALLRAVGTGGALPDEVRYEVDVPPHPLQVRADPGQLRQVLDQLLKNALQAVGGAGVVRVTAAGGAGRAVIRVADTGPGVAPEHRPQLFQPFFTTKAKGTGLGLWICKQIIERHGGSIRLSAAGPGTTVEIDLPVGGDGGPGGEEP